MKYSLEIKPSFCYKNNSGIESCLLIPVISPAIWRGLAHTGDVRFGHKFLGCDPKIQAWSVKDMSVVLASISHPFDT